jgi:ligand-binding SRPBCC domain-containing protein
MAAYLECVTHSTRSASEMFDLARDIAVHTESQSGASEQAIAGVTEGLIGLGEQVTWRASHWGIPFNLTSRVTEFEAPRRFVDEQTHGPFTSFRHEHLFEPTISGSVMIDRIHFSAPFGIVGKAVETLVLARYLRRLIEDRGRYLAAR